MSPEPRLQASTPCLSEVKRADIMKLEQETVGMMAEIVGGGE